MSIRETSSDPTAGVQKTPVTPQSKDGVSARGSHGARSIKEDSTSPKIPRDKTPASVTRLSERAIQQLKEAITASNSGDPRPLQEWCDRHAIKSVDPRKALLKRDLISEDRNGNLIYKPLHERKIQKSGTDLANIVKASLKAAKKAKPKTSRKKSGGSAVKNARAIQGKKRRKNNASVTDGDSAIDSTPTESNPLMSVNHKDREEGPEGVKAEKVSFTTQKSK
ncbi:MAG: hypothetical protein ACR2PT_07600 [Endozoicomonas sp.]